MHATTDGPSATSEGAAPLGWPESPFFGAREPGLALLQLDVADARGPDFTAVAQAIRQCAAETGRGELRWQLGVGAPLFAHRAWLPRPQALRPLRLNGDVAYGLQAGADETALLLALGAEYAGLAELAQWLVIALERCGLAARSWHFGHHAGTERDHTGFLDGTSNLQELTPAQFAACVFVQAEDDPRFAGGSYLVARKYEEDLQTWNDLPEEVQELFVGRQKGSGRFLDGGETWSESSVAATSPFAHVRRAHARERRPDDLEYWTERIYRRSVKFVESDGPGVVRYGYLFLALQRDPRRQFERIHNQRLVPETGVRDHFLASGYLKPMATACYYIAPFERLRTLLQP